MSRGGRRRAPKVGDKAAWAKVIAQGQAVAVDHAIKGIRAMPPKGGNPDFENIEVERAVVFMANNAGASWKEPAGREPVAVTASGERTGEEVVAAAAASATRPARAARRRSATARRGRRAKRGYKPVLQSALKGHGGMPARGGMADLSDAEIKRAVEYMFNSGVAQPVVATVAAAAAAPAAAPARRRSPTARRSTTRRASSATAPASPARRSSATRRRGRRDSRPASTRSYTTALKGKAAMPAKGGNTSLSDADVKAAVDYMAAAAR